MFHVKHFAAKILSVV